jgi:hypothetical protein
MPTTPTYGIPYPALTDSPNGPAQMEALAEEVETELTRIDDDVASLGTDLSDLTTDVGPVTEWASYVPNWGNAGPATFSTRTGRWRRIGPKTVAFTIHVVVSGDGTGVADAVFTSLPTAPSRAVRQTFAGHVQGSNSGHLQAVTFTSGTGVFVDRILRDGTNLVGSAVDSGDIYTISGVYEEA